MAIQGADPDDFWCEVAQEAIENIPQDPGGRNRVFWRQQFILNMAMLWDKATGKKPTVSWDA